MHFIRVGPQEGILDLGVFASNVGGILDLIPLPGGEILYVNEEGDVGLVRYGQSHHGYCRPITYRLSCLP